MASCGYGKDTGQPNGFGPPSQSLTGLLFTPKVSDVASVRAEQINRFDGRSVRFAASEQRLDQACRQFPGANAIVR